MAVVVASATDWASAIGSIVAALVASLTLLVAFMSLRPQLAALRRQQAESERAQAVKVSAWAERRRKDDAGRTIVVRNSSEEPVYDCRAWLVLQADASGPEGPPDFRPSAIWPVVPPQDELRYLIETSARRPKRRPAVVIEFFDTERRRWFRDQNGKLVKM